MSAVEGWQTKQFRELGTLFSGSTPPTTVSSYWDGEVVWVTPNDLSKLNTPYLMDSAKRITAKGLKGCSAHLLPSRSIVISSRAPIGYVAIPSVEFCTNQGCKSIELKDDFDPEFTYYNILFNIHRVKNLGEGTTFAEISKATLSNVQVDFPTSKPEQTKIAEVLSTVDRAIEQTEALIAKQQRIKTGLMQDLLTRGIDEHGNLRSEETHEFKDSPLGRIPVEWNVAPISEYGPRDRPFLRTGPFGSDLNTRHWADHGVPVLTIGSLGEGTVNEAELFFVDEPTAEALDGFRVSSGDIVFSRVADIGRSLVVNESQGGWIISSNLMRISLDKAEARPAFLYRNIAFNSAIRAQLRTTSNSGGRDLVNGPILHSLVFPWPDVGEQDRINEKIDSIDAESRASQQSLQKLRSLKTALMQDLLTGEKRVTPLLEAEAG